MTDIISRDKERERLGSALALALRDPENVEAIAANHGTTAGTLIEILSTQEGWAAASVQLETMRQDGSLFERLAAGHLETTLDLIGSQLSAGAVSPALAMKLAEVLYKLTGVADERAARLRLREEVKPMLPLVHIQYEGEEPPQVEPGRDVVFINIQGPRPAHAGGRVIDVTPEGGEDD